MKQIELIEKRKPREKHFLQEDGTIIAKIYNDDIHFLKNGKYEEIDNTLVEDSEFYRNKNNNFIVKFPKDTTKKIFKLEKNGNYMEFNICNNNNISKKLRINPLIKNLIEFKNLMNNIDLDYKILNNKIKESIVLKSNQSIPSQIDFEIITNLDLIVSDDGSIISSDDNCFIIEKPYMIDNKGKKNENVYYKLQIQNDKFLISLILDVDWLNASERDYPIIIDPTISTNDNNGVYDTYICSNNSNYNYNNYDKLIVGAETYDGETVPTIYRSLIKFDLPELSTGCEIVEAQLHLMGYVISDIYYQFATKRMIEVHKITAPWTETGATWDNMNSNYDSRIESCFYGGCSYYNGVDDINWQNHYADITNLVKKWYIDNNNYGIMLKASDESGVDDGQLSNYIPRFFSNCNIVTGDNPQPELIIKYKNHSGLENYLEYFTQDFSVGKVKTNVYNGNLIALFNLASFKTGNIPAALNIVYNTNDVINNYNIGYGKGWRLNLAQTISYISSENILEYIDFDGTTHYFNNSKQIINSNGQLQNISETDTYYDEDGLNIIIKAFSDKYELIDKNNSVLEFTKQNDNSAKLTKITDNAGNYIIISYNNDKINKITDSYNREINLTYNTGNIVITSPDEYITLNYSNNTLNSIVYGESLINTAINFLYNNNKLISSVQYDSYRTVNYEYYNKSPYKVKKITESNNFVSITYNYLSTTMTDNFGKIVTMVFNNNGNLISISNLKSQDFIKTALGRTAKYGEEYQEKNKLLSMTDLIGYTNNLLSNISFETNNNIFTNEAGIISMIVDDCSNSGEKSLKIVSTQQNKCIYKALNVLKGKNYTFSAYVKNDTIGPIKLSLKYSDYSGNQVEKCTEITTINENFSRYDVSINYPTDATSNLIIKIGAINNCTFYIDDIQLEEGNVANHFNYIENSDFSNGFDGWNTSATQVIGEQIINIPNRFEIVTLPDSSNALKVKMYPLYTTGIYKTLPLSGIVGDNYTISFWYKNKGITHNDDLTYNTCIIGFEYENGQGVFPHINLNPNENEWQFFSHTFYAEHNYNSIFINIFQMNDANDLYITNFSLLKNTKKSKLGYDIEGNVVSVTSVDEKTTSFNYDGDNKLIQIFDEVGNNLSFEYDNIITDRIINGISDSGISNEIKYNFQNIPIITKTSNKVEVNVSNGIYKIKLSGVDKYINIINKNLIISQIDDFATQWLFSSVVIDDKVYYKIKHPVINDAYISRISSDAGISDYSSDNSLFELIINNNRSYSIKLYNSNRYLMVNDDNNIVFVESNGNDLSSKYQFYFEKCANVIFIENSGKYDSNGLIIKEITDSNLHTINYNYDVNSGKLDEFKNVDNVSTHYYYENTTGRLLSICVDDRTIQYVYNDIGQISTINYIVSGLIKKSYFYVYDDDKRLISVKVGKINNSELLYTNTYDDNTGDLLCTQYPNNNTISYEYDDMGRVSKMTTIDEQYKYFYYNTGLIGKILSNIDTYKYIYDKEDKLKKYIYNDFVVDYIYDNYSCLLSSINYKLNSDNYLVNYEYGIDDVIKKISNSDFSYEYIFDQIGRLCGQKINNILYTEYAYIKNGKRETKLLKNISNNGDIYYYKYDKKDNVNFIFHNNLLEIKYEYDDFNQLIREDNYLEGITTRYKYDNSGNVLTKKIYNLNSYELIDLMKFDYQISNNPDILTSIGNESIMYDSCFNPVSIGNNISLVWKNKNQLSEYCDISKNITINYLYDKDGFRTEKNINNIQTNYYWCNGQLIIEKTGNNVLHFIYDTDNNLLGFKYNDSNYTYIRNGTQEIIGIIDNNNNYVAKYCYDSWGNILKITDGNNVDVSQNNTHIANINPFRYKSYYYDKETELYYLNTRYYNSKWCRFINPDDTINDDIFGTNPYIYCSNNPVNRKDSNGAFWGALGIAVTGAFAGAAIKVVSNLAQGKKVTDGLLGAAVTGAVGSLFSVYGIATGVTASILSTAAGSLVDEMSSYVSIKRNTSKNKSTPLVSVELAKEINSSNLYDSFLNFSSDVLIDGLIAGKITNEVPVKKFINKIAYFNEGWFEPKKLISGFASRYTFKKTMHELVEDSINESLSMLFSPKELNNPDINNVQTPIIENNCPPFTVNGCPVSSYK